MNMNQDIRWIQRFSNYCKALVELECAVELFKDRGLSKLEKQGLIQCFEYTHELSWKTIKDFLEGQGAKDMFGSKDTTREAFKLGIITDGEIWMQMSISRNLTSHIYDETTVNEIAEAIVRVYISRFKDLRKKLNDLKIKLNIPDN